MRNPQYGRCSGLPRLWACPSSWASVNELREEEPGEPSRLGTVVHAGLAAFVRTRNTEEAYAAMSEHEQWDTIDHDEATGLLEVGVNSAAALGIGQAGVEVEVKGAGLTGHADMLRKGDAGLVEVWDWKTGWKDVDHNPAVRGYLYCAWDSQGRPGNFRGRTHVVWLRMRVVDTEEYTAEDMLAFEQQYKEKLAQIGQQERPGGQCGFCPRSHECESYATWLEGSCDALMLSGTQLITAEQWRRSWDAIAELDRRIKIVKKMRREFMETHGPLNFGDGYEARFVLSHPEVIAPDAAWPILEDELGQDALAGCTKLAKGKIEKAIRAKAPNGKKQAAWEGVRQKLALAGALKRGEVKQLRRVKRQEASDG